MTNHLPPPLPDAPPTVVDPLAARLQARLDTLVAAPDLDHVGRRHHRVDPAPAVEVSPDDHEAGISDLNAQLEHLRTQLEAAFDDVDGRIDAALGTASDADQRAQIASARAASVLEAVEELTASLTSIAEQAEHATSERLRSAVSRLRSRLQPTAGP